MQCVEEAGLAADPGDVGQLDYYACTGNTADIADPTGLARQTATGQQLR